MKDQWTKDYLNYEKETILDQISNELSAMSVNDFSNLVDDHDLGIEDLDEIFFSVRERLYEQKISEIKKRKYKADKIAKGVTNGHRL